MKTQSPVHPKPRAKPAVRASARSRARQRRQRQLLIRGILIAAVVVTGLFLVERSGGGDARGDTSASAGPPFVVGSPGPGKPAPAISLPSSAGGTYDLAAQSGKTVLLYFHEGLGCQPCWEQIKDIEKDFASFKALGIDSMVAISGNPVSDLRRKAADEGLATTVLADPKLSLGKTYNANKFGMMGTSAYGHSFIVVGPDGTITWRADYGGDPEYTMYLETPALLADLRAGLAGPE